jgi:transcriptional regulator with XRE-family HTH domain
MTKAATEHAGHLRRALATSGLTQVELATALGVNQRTVTNWMSRSQPTMPRDRDLANLARLLPGYASATDPVERELRQSELAPWRQSQLIAEYQRHLHEQGREDQQIAQ